jgi:hypothetical protein
MVRQNLSLRQAALQLGEEVTPQQADNIAGRIRFQEALDEARLAYAAEIGSHPKLTREAVIGRLYQLAERLAANHEDYKAADAYLKLAKTAGFVGAEAPPSVLSTLTQSELDEVRQRIRQMKQAQDPQPTEAHQPERSAGPKQVN